MQKLVLILLVSFFAGYSVDLLAQNRFWVAATASNWNNSANWSTTSGGAGGASVPGLTEVAIFNANGSGNCNLDIAPTVDGVTVNGYSGIINFQGNNLTSTGTNQFTTGTLVPGTTASLILNTLANTTFNGATISVNVSGTTGRLFLNGSTFNGTVNITKTDAANDNSAGGNTFNSAVTLTNASDGHILLGNTNSDQFNGITTFNNNGGYRFYFAHNHGGQTTNFATDVFINSNKPTGTDGWSYLVCEGANTAVSFGGNVTINNTGAVQSNQRILQGIGTQATYSGTVTINLTNTHASTSINMGATGTTVFNGNIVVSNSGGANGIYFNNGPTASSALAATRTITLGGGGYTAGTLSLLRFTQTGTTSQALTGFTGTASLVVGPGSQFDGNVNFIAPRLYLNGCTYGGTGNFEKTGAGNDIGTGGNIFTGVTSVTNSGTGSFYLGNGDRDQFLSATTFTNTGENRFYFANNHTGLTTEFASTLTLNSNKTGGSDGWSFFMAEGANTFVTIAGAFTLNNAGSLQSNCRFLNGNGSTAVYGGLVTLNSTNSNPATIISIGESGTSTYNANIHVSNTGGAAGITFNSGAGSSSILNGTISSAGFTSGSLNLYRFTQVGPIPQALTLTATGTILRIGPGSSFDGDVNFVSPRLLLQGATYNGTSYFEKNNAMDDASAGGNTFNGFTTIVNSGTGYFLTGNTSPDIFNGDVTVTNTGNNFVYLAYNTAGNQFNGNITLNNTGTALGIRISYAGSGEATFSAGATRTISVGGSGFSTGELALRRFTQTGTAAQALTLTGASTQLIIGPASEFNGAVNFVSPRLYLQGAVYNGVTSLEKSGNSNDISNGGNTFNGSTTFVNSGAGYLLTANSAPDIFNGDATFTNTGSDYIYLAYNVAGNQFNGNITLNNTGSALGIRFCHTTAGAATFSAGVSNTISIGGLGFSTGELGLRRFTQLGSSAQTLVLTGFSTQLVIGPSSEFNGNVMFTSPSLLLNGCLYNGTAYLEKTSTTSDSGLGGNTFAQTTTLVNSGSNYLLTGLINPDIFNGVLTLNNNGSSSIRLADNSAGNQFNENIELNSTSGGGIFFGNNVNGTSTLAAGKTIAVGTSGFITGDVRLIRFTQTGSTSQTLDLGGIAILTLGPSSSFGGNVDFRSPQLLLNGATFSGISYLEKKGATDNYGTGGNTFVGSSTIVNSGSGYLAMGQSSPDVFQSDVTVTSTGSERIFLANNVAGNVFNGNIIFNSTLGSGGIYIGNNTTAAATLGTGASLLTGGLGFSSGELRLRRLTQLGSSAQTLVLTGTGLLRIGPSTTFNGDLDFRAPQIALDGAVYNGTTYLEKTGATNNDSGGGNSFLGASTTIVNSGTGQFRFAVTTLDTFGAGDLILINTGTSSIRMADNAPGSVFNGNIFVNSTFGAGVFFSESGGGTATLAAGRSIAVGGTGFTTGELRLRRFTQADATTPQTLLMGGTSSLILGPTIAFSGDVNFRAPQVYLNGGVFNGPAYIEKTGATDNNGTGNMTFQSTTTLQLSGTGYFRTNGNNTFNGSTEFINTGSHYMLFELNTGSTYNGDLTLTNSGSSNIRMAYNGTSAFNGNILVNSTSGTGIYFSEIATGFSTLATGRTLGVGGTGFTAGELRIERFTQTGSTPQNIALTGSSTLRTGPTTVWNGDLTVSAPGLFLNGTTFNGTTNTLTKTGATTDASVGGNIFSTGTTTIANSGSGVFRLASTTSDDFTGNVIFNQASGTIQPAYNQASTFSGDVTVISGTSIVFGANNGGATFTGTASQNINRGGTASPAFRRLILNKPAGTVTLTTDATVSVTATFTSGILHTTAVNYLNFADNATATGANDLSFVDGPVRKTGNDVFTFPIGDNTFYRPAAITAPGNAAHYFTAQYVNADHGLGSAGDPTFTSISKCEYWTIDRNPGPASNVFVTLSWREAACVPGYITDPSTLRVARWNGASWANHGNGGTTGTATNGTIVTSAAVTSFSPFTLASASLANPLPVELKWFNASITPSGTGLLAWRTESELNNDRFEIERSENGRDFTTIGRVAGAGTSNQIHDYQFEDTNPILSLVYYRLKQVDFDGSVEYSSLVSLDYTSLETGSGRFTVSPNPVNSGSFARFASGTRAIRQSVTVYNSVNQVVRQYSEVEGFSTEGLSSGIYIVKNKTGEIFRLVIK